MLRRLGYLLLTLIVCGAIESGRLWAQIGRPRDASLVRQLAEPFSLLIRQDVRNELGLDARQAEAIRALGGELRDRMLSFSEELGSLEPAARRTRIAQEIAEVRELVQKRVSEVLTTDQQQRLQQLRLRAMVQFGWIGDVLATDQIRQPLAIDDQQMATLREAAAEARREFDASVQQAMRRAQDRVIGSLTDEQREQWQRMLGSPFDFGVGQSELSTFK